jgi:hypothetical protein
MKTIIKDLVFGISDLWKHDRKEFWDLVLGFTFVTFWMWFSLYVLIPIFGD